MRLLQTTFVFLGPSSTALLSEAIRTTREPRKPTPLCDLSSSGRRVSAAACQALSVHSFLLFLQLMICCSTILYPPALVVALPLGRLRTQSSGHWQPRRGNSVIMPDSSHMETGAAECALNGSSYQAPAQWASSHKLLGGGCLRRNVPNLQLVTEWG